MTSRHKAESVDAFQKRIEAQRAKWDRQEKVLAEREKKRLEKAHGKFPALEGFVGEWKKDMYRGGTNWVSSSEALKVRFVFRPGGGGTCEFEVTRNGQTHWSNFDRTGVSDSFYWATWDKVPKVQPGLETDLKDLLKQVEKTREFHKTSLSVPGIGFTVSPDRKAGFATEFKKRGYVQFTPSGFGTGHTFTSKRASHGQRATPAQEEFFGVSPLWHHTMDCD